MWKGISHLIKGVKNLLYPPYCLFCQADLVEGELELFCPACFKELTFLRPENRCPRCFQADCVGQNRCRIRNNFCRHILAPFEYGGSAESLVHAFKIGGRAPLAEGMAAFMALVWLESGYPLPDIIVPVPGSPVTSFKRGFEPSRLLAQTLSSLFNRPLWRGLKKEPAYLKQAQLTQKERLANLYAPLYLSKDPAFLRDKRILLVDDVMTTGHTLNRAAELLFEGYPRSVDALIFAAADRD
jgi:ComF family protein